MEDAGSSGRGIGRELESLQNRLRRYLKSPEAIAAKPRWRRRTKLDPHAEYIDRRLAEGVLTSSVGRKPKLPSSSCSCDRFQLGRARRGPGPQSTQVLDRNQQEGQTHELRPVSHILAANIEGLLNFFDEKPDWSVGHATGMVGIVGEGLNTACLQDYLGSKGGSATVLRHPDTGKPFPVTKGYRQGPRVDRWIRVEWSDRPATAFRPG